MKSPLKCEIGKMGILDDLLARVRYFNEGLDGGSFLSGIMERNEDEILALNTEEQLYERGITSRGVRIDSYAPYSPLTIEIKKGLGQPYDRVTLRDTGAFERSFWLDFDHEKVWVEAFDAKTEELMAKYGDDILGFTDENIGKIVRQFVFPDIMEIARKTLMI